MPEQPPTAISGEGKSSYEEEFRVIGQILERDAVPIMERWFERAGEEQVHAAPLHRKDAMNQLLAMLKALATRLQDQSSQALKIAAEFARDHGRQRSDLGWDVVELARDYEILHGVVLEHMGKTLGELLSYRQAMVIATVMNVAVGQAIESYNLKVQQKLEEQVKRQQSELRQLALDLTDAEHHERQRIAARLHDDLQQILVAMQMHLNTTLRASMNHSALEAVIGLSDQAIKAARDLASELNPIALDEKGLAAAMEWLAQMFQQRYNLAVAVEAQVGADAPTAQKALRRLMFQIIRELLFNIVKHAHTNQAWVRICCDTESTWRIEVEDRGVGLAEITTAAAGASKGFGLASVAQRIKQVGGTMDVHSRPGEGTRIVLTVPLEQT